MPVDFFKEIAGKVIPMIIAGITVGITVFLFQKYWDNGNIFGDRGDYSGLTGHWYGVHVTKHPTTGLPTLSRHEYDLKVTKNGKITGTLRDDLMKPSKEWIVRGNAFPGGMALIDQHSDRPNLYGVEFYRDHIGDPSILQGVVTSFDFRANGHFASIIILSRSVISDEDFEKQTINLIPPTFYTNLQNLKLLPEPTAEASLPNPNGQSKTTDTVA